MPLGELVALTFHPLPTEAERTDYRLEYMDGDPANTRPANLRWHKASVDADLNARKDSTPPGCVMPAKRSGGGGGKTSDPEFMKQVLACCRAGMNISATCRQVMSTRTTVSACFRHFHAQGLVK